MSILVHFEKGILKMHAHHKRLEYIISCWIA